jgi:hypothetical protein
MSLQLTWIYENTVTSELIVPASTKIIKDLVDLVDAGYKVEYTANKGVDVDTYFQEVFASTFIHRNVPHKFRKNDFISINANKSDLSRYGNSDNKLAFFFIATPDVVAYWLVNIKIATQNQKCYNIKTPISATFDLAYFETADREELVKMVGRFREVGLIQFWSDLAKYLDKLVTERGYYGKLPVEQLEILTLINLASLFIFCSFMLGFALLFFGFEIRSRIILFVQVGWRSLLRKIRGPWCRKSRRVGRNQVFTKSIKFINVKNK